jgi:hypothetical protein
MAEDEKGKGSETTAPPDDELEEEAPKAEASEDDDDTEGHVSITDVWLPSNNKWRRRRP